MKCWNNLNKIWKFVSCDLLVQNGMTQKEKLSGAESNVKCWCYNFYLDKDICAASMVKIDENVNVLDVCKTYNHIVGKVLAYFTWNKWYLCFAVWNHSSNFHWLGCSINVSFLRINELNEIQISVTHNHGNWYIKYQIYSQYRKVTQFLISVN